MIERYAFWLLAGLNLKILRCDMDLNFSFDMSCMGYWSMQKAHCSFKYHICRGVYKVLWQRGVQLCYRDWYDQANI